MLTAKRRAKQVAARNAARKAENFPFNHPLDASMRGRVQKNAGGENFLLASGKVSAILCLLKLGGEFAINERTSVRNPHFRATPAPPARHPAMHNMRRHLGGARGIRLQTKWRRNLF